MQVVFLLEFIHFIQVIIKLVVCHLFLWFLIKLVVCHLFLRFLIKFIKLVERPLI